MDKYLNSSVIITGPSASGKSTLFCCLVVHFGLIPTPVHTTRKPRQGEVMNVDGVFLSEQEYVFRFNRGDYLEESLDAGYFSGAYYGSPKEWIDLTMRGDFSCFVCPTVRIAKKVKARLKNKIIWIHLSANTSVRKQRLMRRNPDLEKETFDNRIQRGNANIDVTGHDVLIDTSYLTAGDIFSRALYHL